MLDKDNQFNFSFSGLKTAVLTEIQKLKEIDKQTIADISASFQMAVIDVLSDKLVLAADIYKVREVHLAGGVSANQVLREVTSKKLKNKIPLIYPKNLIYCTDNAAMVAGAAYFCPQKKGDFKKVEAHSQLPLET
jgi:N6-L-threonylcarbamoyladenine synthase